MALPGKLDLNHLSVFQAVAEAGGFTAGAARLGVATPKVSLEIARLERHLGTALFTRTTRRVALTDAGQALYDRCAPLLGQLTDAVDDAVSGQHALEGTLRIASTVDHAAAALAPALAAFGRKHPGLTIDLRTADRVVDLVAEGIDVAIRLGWPRDSSLRAVRLGEFEQFVVAAPDHVRAAGRPRAPADLARMDWIALTLLATPLTWHFTGPDGGNTTVHVKPRLRVDSPSTLKALLRQGAGVSVLDQFNAREGIRERALVRLLPRWTLPRGGIHAVFPPGRQVPAKVRAFVEDYRVFLMRSGWAAAG